MNALRSPGLVASVAFGLALAVHPRLGFVRADPTGRAALVTLALLLTAALAARAVRGGAGERLVALGAALVLGAVGWDDVRGQRGTLTLSPGEASQNFLELGTDGRPLGLRPLGFQMSLEDLQDTTAVLALPEGRAVVTPTRAAGARGVRFGRPQLDRGVGAGPLQLTVTDASGEQRVMLADGEAARHGDLEVALERYFPDFALDANNEPFSRSDEPHNPAALLSVRKGAKSYRVFVLASMPGIHKVEGLDASFALTAVDAPRTVALRVSVAPAAPWALLGLVCISLGLALQARAAPPPRSLVASGLAPGALLCGALLTLGGGDVLKWSWTSGLDAVPSAWPGAGLTLGVALIAALGGTLLVAAAVIASGAATPARPLVLGRRAQILAATLAGIGAIQLVAEAGFRFEVGYEAILLAVAATALALSLASSDPRGLPRGAAAVVVLLLSAVGVGSWLRWGGHDTAAVEAVASLALLALAVSE